jgi:hypothetical protein
VSFADLAVQKEKAGNSDQDFGTISLLATETIGKLSKRAEGRGAWVGKATKALPRTFVALRSEFLART